MTSIEVSSEYVVKPVNGRIFALDALVITGASRHQTPGQ